MYRFSGRPAVPDRPRPRKRLEIQGILNAPDNVPVDRFQGLPGSSLTADNDRACQPETAFCCHERVQGDHEEQVIFLIPLIPLRFPGRAELRNREEDP